MVIFDYVIALFIGLLVAAPVVAHLLRRGKTDDLPFPPAGLVPPTEHVARRRNRLKDAALLLTRGSTIVVLALLGAVPLLRCERPSLARRQGASIAMALVIDDSASMRARASKTETRFEVARRIATQLIEQTREGDMISVILAGQPARLALAASSNRSTVRAVIQSLVESDRATDIVGALSLAQSSLGAVAQTDKRVVLLSDLAGEIPKTPYRPLVWERELARPVDDCGVVTATVHNHRIQVEVACSSAQAAHGRKVLLVVDNEADPATRAVALAERAGVQQLSLTSREKSLNGEVRLTGADDNPTDDAAPTFSGLAGLVVSTFTDPVTERVVNGGPPLLEQALHALDDDMVLRPLATLPEEPEQLKNSSLLLLDDPPAFGPEVRSAMVAYVQQGGLAVALLGPRASVGQLGTSLAPFVDGRASWKFGPPASLDESSLSWLVPGHLGFTNLAARGRWLFDESLGSQWRVRGRWSDDHAWLAERALGRGLVRTVGLPSSPDWSDLAFRPGFLALLRDTVQMARGRGRTHVVVAGQPWSFPPNCSLHVRGPQGKVEATATRLDNGQEVLLVVPTIAGRYRIEQDGRSDERLAVLPTSEILTAPRRLAITPDKGTRESTFRLDLSPQLALALLALMALEIGLAALYTHLPPWAQGWRPGRSRSSRNGSSMC